MADQQPSILSVDIGGETCKMGRVSPRGSVEEVTTVPTEEIRKGGVESLIRHLKTYERKSTIHGIAMGVPATVDWDHNHVRGACTEVPWLNDAVNKKKIQDELRRPLLLMNDVEALLVGEWKQGELKGMNSGVVISLGASMGSALLWDGQPQQGRRGSIMELEHVSLNTYGDSVDSYPPGSSGTWLSGDGLKRRMKEEAEVIPLPEFFRSEQDPYASLREQFVDKLAHLLGVVVMMLDPERIVLAGGLTGSYRRWLPEVKERMDQFVMEQFRGIPSVVLGQLRGDEVIHGPAAFWSWRQGRETD